MNHAILRAGNGHGTASKLLDKPYNNPPYDIDQDHWGSIDLTTGVTSYFIDEDEAEENGNASAHQVIGTVGLGICTGVMIVSRTYAIVGHFTAGAVDDYFKEFVMTRAGHLHGACAWVLYGADEFGVADDESTQDVKFLDKLFQSLNMPAANVAKMKYERPLQTKEAEAEYGNNGQGDVVVDGRDKTKLPLVYVWNFLQPYPPMAPVYHA